MARIVDYATVLRQAETLGLRSAYYNAGAFTYPPGEPVHVVGWTGPTDPTIRPGLGTLVGVDPPYPENLAARFAAVWPAWIDGEAWVMPKAHWSFELDHGNGAWLGPPLAAAGVDPDALRGRTDGSAVAFPPGDGAAIALLVTLLANLKTSDFAVLFPQHRHLVTVHHHQQLWWQTPDVGLVGRLGGWAGNCRDERDVGGKRR